MTRPPLLSLDSVTMRRHNKAGQGRVILDQVSLDIYPASVVALTGASGSGKSTLLRLLNRLEDPTGGLVSFSGENLKRLDPLQLRRQVSLVMQKPFMFPGTVLQNLHYPFTARGEMLPSDIQVDEAMALCGVDTSWLQELARKLSVGQQQRVSLARTWLNRPQVLLLDEPTSSLDPDTAARVVGRLARAVRNAGMALLMVTHDHLLAKKHADRLLALSQGRITERDGGT